MALGMFPHPSRPQFGAGRTRSAVGTGGSTNTPEPPEPPEPPQVPPPLGEQCRPRTFAEDMAARRQTATPSDIRNATAALTGTASVAVGTTQSLAVSSSTISGRITNTGFDGVPRSRPADVGAQATYLRNAPGYLEGLRTTGRTLGVAGGAFSAYDLVAGAASGDRNQAFNGAYGATALFLGLAQPGLGIGMGIVMLIDQLRPEPPLANILDAVGTASGCP